MALHSVDPAAHTTLCRHFDDICRSNLHPDDLAKHLVAKGIITEHTVEQAANSDTAPKSLQHLVHAIMQHGRKEGFGEFLDFVQSDTSTRWLATRIRETYMHVGDHQSESSINQLGVSPNSHTIHRLKMPKPEQKQKPSFLHKLVWTIITLVVFAICCQIPLFGIKSPDSNVLNCISGIVAPNRGTIMELGYISIAQTSALIQLLSGTKCIEPLKPKVLVIKLLHVTIMVAYATMHVLTGTHGHPGDLGAETCALIVIQLVCGVLAAHFLYELLNRRGLGSGLELFVATNTCGIIVWKLFSTLLVSTSNGLHEAFFRQYAPNLMNVVGTILVFAVIIYVQCFRVELRIRRAHEDTRLYPIRLLYTAYTPLTLHMVLVYDICLSSRLLASYWGENLILNLLGRWSAVGGTSYVTGGLCYYLVPFTDASQVFVDPICTVVYTAITMSLCALLSSAWTDVASMSAKDVAEQLKRCQYVIVGHRETSVARELNRHISIAASFGGMCAGALSVLADLFGFVGSGYGILVTVTLMHRYVGK
ncbi:hypothetical protein EMCRGX_G027828 [Ephydatia muelleri]